MRPGQMGQTILTYPAGTEIGAIVTISLQLVDLVFLGY